MTDKTIVRVTSFDPLQLELPAAGEVSGAVVVKLPPLRVTWGRLDLVDLPVTGELPGLGYSFDLAEPVPTAKLAEMVTATAPHLRGIWQAYQTEMDKRGAVYGPGKLPPAFALAALQNSLAR